MNPTEKMITCAVSCACGRLERYLLGKRYRVLTDWNGQSYGKSKPSLKGKVFTVRMVSISASDVQVWDGDYAHCYIRRDEIEILEPVNEKEDE